MTIDVRWIDHGREPTCKPDPAFPKGQLVNLAPSPIVKTCTRNLPYPAPRCGLYAIACRVCGFTATISTAGRADDPSMVTMPCKARGLDG